MKVLGVSVALVASMLVAVAAGTPAGATPSADLVISQVYGGGGNAGATFNADYVELFNRGTAPAPLGGLSVQYASATGTGNLGASGTQLVALPAVDVPAGGRFLVGLAGGTAGVALPTPDTLGTINMAGGAGKVALATGATSLGCNGSSTPCSTDQLARIVDLVGYGNATFSEGSPAPTLTSTTAAQRTSGGCVDTDSNAADFTAVAPSPGNSAGSPTPCDGPPANTPPSVTSDPFPIQHTAGTTVDHALVVTDDVSVVDVVVAGPLPDGITVDTGTAGATRTITISIADTVPVGGTGLALTLVDDAGATTSVTGTIDVVRVDACGVVPTNTIMEVQGSGVASPLVGRTVGIEGVVTASFQPMGQVGGFYLQDPIGDGDPTTSDGVLVFDNADQVQPGDLVRVTGRVTEFERSANAGAGTVTELGGPITVTSCGQATVPPTTTVQLPFAAPVGGVPTQERYEGMLVTMPDARTVTEVFTLGRFGEVWLTDGPPLFTPTNGNVPGTFEQIDAANRANRILLDDARSGSNLYPGAYVVGDDPDAVLRVGDHVAAGDVVTGVLTFDNGNYRVQPLGEYVDFVTGIPRPAAPDQVGGDVQIASFNVLNYFTSIDDDRWSGNDTPRGATSAAELTRQQTKIVAGIRGLDADVVGLIEIENNGPSPDPRVGPDAVATLVGAINAGLPVDQRYSAIDAPDVTAPNFLGGTFGTDAIKVAIIYRPSVVTPVGSAVADPALIDPPDPDHPGESLFDRPPIVQVFQRADGAGVPFSLIVNHFKSKGSLSTNCAPGGGGLQGNCNDLRVRQAQGVLGLIEGAGLSNVALLGDLNAYSLEDPIVALEAAGFTSPADTSIPASDRFSYVFDGMLGELDHALVDTALAPHVTGVDIWHINSIEPPAKDYTSFNDPALYEPNAYRSSDHDPVLLGLDLTALHVDDAVIVQKPRGGGSLVLSAHVDGTYTTCPVLALTVEGAAVVAGPTTRLPRTTTCVSLTSKGLVTFDLRTGAVAAVLSLPSSFTSTDRTVTFSLTTNAATHAADVTGRRTGPVWRT
jgi:predicted extracellular nuclease